MSLFTRRLLALPLFAVAGFALLPAPAAADLQLTPLPISTTGYIFYYDMRSDGGVVIGDAENADGEYQAYVWSQASGFSFIPLLSTGGNSEAHGLSADGSIVVGTEVDTSFDSRPFYWTAAGGTHWLGSVSDLGSAMAISRDGTTIVGDMDDGAGTFVPMRWTVATGMQPLDTAAGFARAANADGTVVVGRATDPVSGWQNVPFRWTLSGGMTYLPQIGGTFSEAKFVSEDGNVVIGTGDDAISASQVWRWTPTGGMVALTTDSDYSAYIRDVLNDGSAVLIFSSSWTYGDTNSLWREGSGFSSLASYGGSGSTYAQAMTADSNLIVGYHDDGASHYTPVRWVNGAAPESLLDVLAAAGVNTAGYATNLLAYDVSDDGEVILLSGISVATGHDQLYLMSDGSGGGGGGGGGAGIITPEEVLEALQPVVQPGLQGQSAVVAGIGQSMFMARNALSTSFISGGGLARRSEDVNLAALDAHALNDLATAAGPSPGLRYAAYATGSFGIGQRNDYGNRATSGNAGLLASPAPDLALGFGVIGSHSMVETELDGSSKLTALGGTFLAAYEPDNGVRLYGTAALARLEAETSRVYANGAGTDASHGETTGVGLGLSLRLGYALEAGEGWQLMPYVEGEYSHTRLGAYVETNGAFPATVAAQEDNTFLTRLGAEASFDVNDALTLRGRLAWGHRYSDEGTVLATSASITQVLGADAGAPNWAEGGLTALYRLTEQTSFSLDLSGRAGATAEPAVNGRLGMSVSF